MRKSSYLDLNNSHLDVQTWMILVLYRLRSWSILTRIHEFLLSTELSRTLMNIPLVFKNENIDQADQFSTLDVLNG